MSLTELINAMESAGTIDLRGLVVVPYALKVHRQGQAGQGPGAAVRDRDDAVVGRAGAHRLDHDNNGSYDQAEAVRDHGRLVAAAGPRASSGRPWEPR